MEGEGSEPCLMRSLIKSPGLTGQYLCREEDTGAGEELWPGRGVEAGPLV